MIGIPMRATFLLAGFALVVPSFRLSVLPSVLAPSGTDIYGAPLERSAGTLAARAADGTRPSSSADGWSLYYASARGGQSDIYRSDFAGKASAQVTATPET